ncbi:alcohol dehydrogenase [Candidatus Nanohalococcus occultus]
MKAAAVSEPGKIEIVEKQVPEPAEDEVLIKVEASSICHSDVFTVEAQRPGIELPITPGHEVIGEIVRLGDEVSNWSEGERIGVGWHGGHCFECEQCRQGNFLQCENQEVTGLTRDGGHAEYMTARKEALAAVPDDLESVDAAPMMCAGVTTFNALRHTDARPGDLVAVVGIGGLGHLGVQYASEAGYETVAISHSADKEEYGYELGADHFIDSSAEDPAQALKELGGADVILCTAPVAESIENVVGGLATNGEVSVVGVPGEEISVNVMDLIGSRGKISGWSTGHARDNQDTLEFGSLREIRAETETFDLDQYAKAYDKMMDGEVRFRAVIEF